MSINANIFWHQTNAKAFYKILSSHCFRYAYSKESPINMPEDVEYAFPMISFAHLAFCELEYYLGSYGNYTIGMKYDWAVQNGITPVLYLFKSSSINCKVIDIESVDESDLNAYVKNYQGPLKSRGYHKYKFYNEREYRFVLSKARCDTEKLKFVLRQDSRTREYDEYKEAHDNLSLLPECFNVKFRLEDVAYLIIPEVNGRIKQLLKQIFESNPTIKIFTITEAKVNILGKFNDVKMTAAEIKSYQRKQYTTTHKFKFDLPQRIEFDPAMRYIYHVLMDFSYDWVWYKGMGHYIKDNNINSDFFRKDKINLELVKSKDVGKKDLSNAYQLRANTIRIAIDNRNLGSDDVKMEYIGDIIAESFGYSIIDCRDDTIYIEYAHKSRRSMMLKVLINCNKNLFIDLLETLRDNLKTNQYIYENE